jgi:hypothetical protein
MLALLIGGVRPVTSAPPAGNDSEMALQAVEIARNGLANGSPPVRFALECPIFTPRLGAYLNCAPSRSIVGRNSGNEVAIIATSSTVIGSRLASPMTRKLIAIR